MSNPPVTSIKAPTPIEWTDEDSKVLQRSLEEYRGGNQQIKDAVVANVHKELLELAKKRSDKPVNEDNLKQVYF
jgi:hypothetical protein